MKNKSIYGTREITIMGMLAAIAVVLMLFEFPLPFIAPPFYELDFSEVPVLVGTFALGPFAGAMIEFLKIILNLLINGTQTAGVGEVANFIIGCAFCVPAGMLYKNKKNKKRAVLSLVVGSISMTIIGCFVNAYIMLPTYAKAFSWPLDKIIEMGTIVNANITDLTSFVLIAVAPFNLLKGCLISVVLLFIYKKISPILKKH